MELNILNEAPDLNLDLKMANTLGIFGSSKRGKSTLIVEIYNKQDNNNMTTGGTMSARSYVVVKFSDNTQITYNSGDVIRVYD